MNIDNINNIQMSKKELSIIYFEIKDSIETKIESYWKYHRESFAEGEYSRLLILEKISPLILINWGWEKSDIIEKLNSLAEASESFPLIDEKDLIEAAKLLNLSKNIYNNLCEYSTDVNQWLTSVRDLIILKLSNIKKKTNELEEWKLVEPYLRLNKDIDNLCEEYKKIFNIHLQYQTWKEKHFQN